jgi:EmrB/QacA subfamily drug resistance transporter
MHRYVIFASAGLGLLMYSIDSTAVAVAFPHFIREFNTNVLWAAWTISIYLVAVTSVMPLMGNLSDTFGRKKVYLISLIVFTASSLACGLAPDIHSLVVLRFVQGIGGAAFLPTAAGIVTDQFPNHRERVIGLFSSIFPIGGIVGPNLGGWIVSQYSWRHIFYINLPIGILIMVLITILLKESKSKVFLRSHIDFLGAFYFFGTTLFLMFALNLVAENVSATFLLSAGVMLAVSLSFLYLFFHHEKKEPNPILDMALLRSKPFLAANAYNAIIGAGVLGLYAFIPLYATSVHKLSTVVSGMIMTPRSAVLIPTSAVTSFFLTRWGYRRPMVVGLIIISLSTFFLGGQGLFSLLKTLGFHFGIAEILGSLMVMMGIGIGIAIPASNNACIELMPDRVATITGLRGTFRSVGGALGISLITIILHISSSPAAGFKNTFICFGLGLFLTIPLVFLMPGKKKASGQTAILHGREVAKAT